MKISLRGPIIKTIGFLLYRGIEPEDLIGKDSFDYDSFYWYTKQEDFVVTYVTCLFDEWNNPVLY